MFALRHYSVLMFARYSVTVVTLWSGFTSFSLCVCVRERERGVERCGTESRLAMRGILFISLGVKFRKLSN